jgi:hypothetical protein
MMNVNELSVVIPLGSGSTRQNIELKYSLRSIEKNIKGVKNIIIVGEKPSFLSDEIIHVPYKDCGRKQLSIKRKIEAAIQDERCTETFLFTNDDVFQLKKQRIDTYPYYYSGELTTVREKGARHTENRLKALGKPFKQFDIHTPCLYTKQGFTEAMSAFDWPNEDHLIKSSYANYHEIKGIEIKDLKISSHLNYFRIKQEIEGRPCYSIGDYCDFNEMLKIWNELYPNPSKYELIKQNKAA